MPKGGGLVVGHYLVHWCCRPLDGLPLGRRFSSYTIYYNELYFAIPKPDYHFSRKYTYFYICFLCILFFFNSHHTQEYVTAKWIYSCFKSKVEINIIINTLERTSSVGAQTARVQNSVACGLRPRRGSFTTHLGSKPCWKSFITMYLLKLVFAEQNTQLIPSLSITHTHTHTCTPPTLTIWSYNWNVLLIDVIHSCLLYYWDVF